MKDWKTAKSFFFKFQTARSDGWKKMKDWKTAKSFFCEFPIRSNERRLMLKENERLKFEKKWNLRFQQRSWDSAQNFEKWKLSQKIEPADINLKISTKNGPQKLFDIKIRTPGVKSIRWTLSPVVSPMTGKSQLKTSSIRVSVIFKI
jgi:hypothetical protein